MKKLWKEAERRLAKLFGTRRRPLSGGNSGTGRDDSLHPRLFLEAKYTSKEKRPKYQPQIPTWQTTGHSAALWNLFREVRSRAQKENRTPVIGIMQKNMAGILLVIHSDDLQTVAKEA